MDEQFQNQVVQNQPSVSIPETKNDFKKMLMINLIITILVSLIISLGVFYFFTEKRLVNVEKIVNAFSGKIKVGK